MASTYLFESRDQRIERMHKNNPGKPIELCTAGVDIIWEKKRDLIQSRIPDRFAGADMQEIGYIAKSITASLAKVFDSPQKNNKVGVIFYGPPGCGKTHSAYAVIRFLLEKNPEMVGYMTSYPEAMSNLKNEFSNNSYDELSSTWDKLTNSSGLYKGILFLDDLNSTKLTDFELDKLMIILEKRLNSHMPFLITTNVAQEDFKATFGERIASRLLGYCELVEFEEVDKRAEEKSL
jgi:DNA replication protein DnaC